MASQRARQAGRQAGRVERDHQRAQPPVACRQPARRRAGGAGGDFGIGRAADFVAADGAQSKIGKLAGIDSGLQAIVDLIEPARIQLQEAVYALNDYLDRVELDPERLRQLNARMEVMHTAARKFRVTPDELPDECAKLSAKLQQLADASDIDGLRKQEEKLKAAYMDVALRLSATRAVAARQLGEA